MRYRRRTLPLTYARDAAQVRALLHPRKLRAARLEPAFLGIGGAGYVDLVFADGQALCCVAMIEIEPEMIEQRESSPFIWPYDIASLIDHHQAAAIEDEILPWIESLAFGRTLCDEHVRFYDASFRDVFETARAAAFLGAAPYEMVFAKAAPYVYAVRFAAGRQVAVNDEFGATGAAVLHTHAAGVRAGMPSDMATLARNWFGIDAYGAPRVAADVTIGELERGRVHIALNDIPHNAHRMPIATPVPMDISISFDAEDAPACAHFGIVLQQPSDVRFSLPVFATAGGSSGRIALLVREDAASTPDADTDAARYLAQRLASEGFCVDVLAARACDPAAHDLIHVLCAAYPEQALDVVLRARSLGKPVVVTEPIALRDAQAFWGPATLPHVLRSCKDEVVLEDHLRLLAARRLELPGVPLAGEPYAGYRDVQRRLLEAAGALVPANAPAFLPCGDAAGVRHVTGQAPYILMHAPIVPRSNQFTAVRAASAAGLRAVLAGPIADFEYANRLRHYAGPGVAFIAEPANDAELMALYADAKVFADPSWFALGTSRRALAAAAGCAVASAPAVDPADERVWCTALRAAWDAPKPAPRPPAEDPLVAVVRAYAAAQQSAVLV